MKNTTLRWLFIALCLVLVGGAVFCAAMAVNHWDFGRLGGEKMETNTFDVAEDFQSISIRSDTEKIAFCPADDGKCKVVFCERENEKHTVSVKNGTLSVERIDTRKWYDHISLFSFGTPTITVYLPRAEYDVLFIEEDTGDVTIPAGFLFGSADIGLSTGDVECRASATDLIRIRTSTGDILLEDASAGALDLTVSTGRAEVRSVACRGDIAVAVSTGMAALTDVTCGSLGSTGSTGDITLQNVIAAGAISIERTTGDVRFEACDAAELTIGTGTGKVTGSLLTDKVFITHSGTGRIDVPETTAGGTCRITTDTGDIKITTAGR